MKYLCKYKGGSHAYGLATPESDVDWRGVFLNTEPGEILGIRSGLNDCESKQSDGDDNQFWELRKFLNMLRKGNTQALEAVYLGALSDYDQMDLLWGRIVLNRERLFDSDRMYKVLRGYAHSERKLANGERMGELGSKRRAAIDRYGYSPKNACNLIRLLWAGVYLFDKGTYPVRVRTFDPKLADNLMQIKTHPEDISLAELNARFDLWERLLEESHATTKVRYEFDDTLANQLCFEAYMPILEGIRSK